MTVSSSGRPAATAPVLGLHELPRDIKAEVVEVRAADVARDQDLILRLIEIGFLPGEVVRVIAHGQPGGDPLAVRLGHTTFALRRHEASLVRVRPGSAA